MQNEEADKIIAKIDAKISSILRRNNVSSYYEGVTDGLNRAARIVGQHKKSPTPTGRVDRLPDHEPLGRLVDNVAKDILSIAKKTGDTVQVKFNDGFLTAWPTDTVEVVIARWRMDLQGRRLPLTMKR